MSTRCLFCYQPLNPGQVDFHPGCSRKIFGNTNPPVFPYSKDNLIELAGQIIQRQIAVTGVQPKLSLSVEKVRGKQIPAKLTIAGLWGPYILKPPAHEYPSLPELEDLTMHLAESCRLNTVPHTLIRMQSNSLAYLTRRIDRTKNNQTHMEDMCQLAGRLTEHKYQGSHEQVAKLIKRYSAHPGLDLINFYEVVLFSFITGNADMHLKNFSLIDQPEIGWVLAPAYDLVPTALLIKGDPDELALTMNGKKRNLTRKDFIAAMKNSAIDQKVIDNIFNKFSSARKGWLDWIARSFISDELKEHYTTLIDSRLERLELT